MSPSRPVALAPREITSVAALAALETFVTDNDDLLALESRIGRFNIFDALKIANVEIRHSNFLAFLLDPAESHGLGQLFLKAFLMDVLKSASPELRPFSPIELDGAELRGIEVRREWRHIDLLITCKEPAFAVVIENKIDSTEHSDQLNRYRSIVHDNLADVRALYVYLTPDGRDPSDEAWVAYSYEDVHRVFTRIRSTYRTSIGQDVLTFLDHYLSLIGTRLMNDPTIDELCRRIYTNHRLALELIYARAGRPGSEVIDEVDSVLRQDSRFQVFSRGPNAIDFILADWMTWLPKWGLDRPDAPQSWFILRFELLYGRQLDYYVEVRQMSDLALRRKVIEFLIDESMAFGFKRKKGTIKDRYTRVSGRERILTWPEEQEAPVDRIRSEVARKLDSVQTTLSGSGPMLRRFLANARPGSK